MDAKKAEEAALLSDMAALKLQEGDAEGAQELYIKALEARQEQQQQQQAQHQQQGDGGAAANAAGGGEEDSWEAWDESSMLPLQQHPAASQADAADSWDSPAAATHAPLASPNSRRTPAGAAAARAAAGAAAGGRSPTRIPTPTGDDSASQQLPFGGGHVVEIYDLTPAVRTQHLEAFLEPLWSTHQVPPTLKWVDDCHAAVICCDPKAARQLLAAASTTTGSPQSSSLSAAAAAGAPQFRLRGYADAGSGTRALPASELQPPRPRPATSAAVARRLIGGALNMKLRDRDAEQQLASTRQRQQQEREQRQRALDAAWEGEG